MYVVTKNIRSARIGATWWGTGDVHPWNNNVTGTSLV